MRYRRLPSNIHQKQKNNNYRADVDWSDELATVNIRYKEPDADTSVLENRNCKGGCIPGYHVGRYEFCSGSCFVWYGIKRQSVQRNCRLSYGKKLAEAGITTGEKQQSYRSQFLEMVEQTENLLIVECN